MRAPKGRWLEASKGAWKLILGLWALGLAAYVAKPHVLRGGPIPSVSLDSAASIQVRHIHRSGSPFPLRSDQSSTAVAIMMSTCRACTENADKLEGLLRSAAPDRHYLLFLDADPKSAAEFAARHSIELSRVVVPADTTERNRIGIPIVPSVLYVTPTSQTGWVGVPSRFQVMWQRLRYH